MKFKCNRLISAAAALLLSAGCAGETQEPTYPVSGVVTFNGEPLEGAVISFTSTGSASAAGRTDANGRYTLTTHTRGDGAQAGKYKVTIAKYDKPLQQEADAEAADTGPSNVDITDPNLDEYPEEYHEMDAQEIAAEEAVNILPDKYANSETSGFEVEVTAGDNTHNFDIEGEAI